MPWQLFVHRTLTNTQTSVILETRRQGPQGHGSCLLVGQSPAFTKDPQKEPAKHPLVGSGQGQHMPGCNPWGGLRKQGAVTTCWGYLSQSAAWQEAAKGVVGLASCYQGANGKWGMGVRLGGKRCGGQEHWGPVCITPHQVPWCVLPSSDTIPPISQRLQQGDRHPLPPSVAGWLRGSPNSTANLLWDTPHHSLGASGIQEEADMEEVGRVLE